jgi:PAS domain S-box-containing protein
MTTTEPGPALQKVRVNRAVKEVFAASRERVLGKMLSATQVLGLVALLVVVPLFAQQKIGGAMCALALVAMTRLCMWLQKRGQTERAAMVYVWGTWMIWGVIGTFSRFYFSESQILACSLLGFALLPRRHAFIVVTASILLPVVSLILSRTPYALPILFPSPDASRLGVTLLFLYLLLLTIRVLMSELQTATDIALTENQVRERAQQSLMASEERNRLLVEHAPVAFIRHTGGVIEYANPAAQSLFGRSELTGARIIDLTRPDLRADVAARMSRIAVGPGIEPFRCVAIERPDGTTRYVDGAHISVYESGALVSQLILVDVSEREQAQRELKSLNERLENEVDARTAELSQANRELEAFSYSLSHDLRAPVRHVLGYIDLYRSALGPDPPAAEASAYLDKARQAGVRMSDMIHGMLALATISRRNMDLSRIQLDVEVRAIVDASEPDWSSRAIEWRIQAVPSIAGDRALLNMLVANLIENALKFTRGREPAVIEFGEAQAMSTDRETVYFLKDNGVGFDSRYGDRLFGVFQRLHVAAEYEGTGIGLATARRIVERHGGRIWAEGEIDRGATFYFALPKLVLPGE